MNDNNRKKYKIPILISIALVLLAVILEIAARSINGFATWYSQHIYVLWVNTLGRISGQVSCSVVELLLYIVIIILVADLIRQIIKRELQLLRAMGCRVLVLAAVLFFLYSANCGVNYYRSTFEEESGITAREYTVEELGEVCMYLTDQVNEYADKVPRDDSGIMTIDQGETKTYAITAMKNLGIKYPCLEGYYSQPKGLLVSEILSYQGLTGIYVPFTIEANYNSDMMDYNIPFTMCHELSHLRGFMKEKESNFIGYLACVESEEATLRYSGNLLAWIYCTNQLRTMEGNNWEEVRTELCDSAKADLAANNEFWDSYEGPVEEMQDSLNDQYLKANGQKDGVRSYDLMVELVVAYLEQ